MPTDHCAQLKEIRTFPSLVRYLRDEMGWPIETDDFEELTFEYTAEELGIDTTSAAKIQDIKRLRPLSSNQPWGIFFIKFEPKRLPVVVLRRILNNVALKKRASLNSDERAAWATDDLLFISNYGEGDKRQISFAHFTLNEPSHLPTLKVLGWDNLDTLLHLDRVAELLTERLAWPNDESDVVRWRESWRSAFVLRPREVITTSKVLAGRLAELARAIRDRIHTVLTIETEKGPVTRLLKALQAALIHNLGIGDFADMYAQTITYGLLSARITNPKSNVRDDLASQLPITNSFLKDLMEAFLRIGGGKNEAINNLNIDFDELGVNEVVELLDDANMEAVIRDFGDRNPKEDPVIHFYELFLKEYDAKQKVRRGVFYTPRPVVSYIVNSVDELLRSEFGLEDGLADTTTWREMADRHKDLTIPEKVNPSQAFVQILDPATGTGTFLVEVIDLIQSRMMDKWKSKNQHERDALWNEYVSNCLLPRIHGFELMMAPYAIAHLKIGLKLHETGYHFKDGERVQVFLTNTLEAPCDYSGQFDFAIPALAREVEDVNLLKHDRQFTVIIGNPPYSNFSANLSHDARQLVSRYKEIDGHPVKERNQLQLERNVNDDYIKFFAKSEDLLGSVEMAVMGMITNASYLDAVTLRGLRARMLHVFGNIKVLDLGGATNLAGTNSIGPEDENVFEIGQPVAISIMCRSRFSRGRAESVDYSALTGSREEKYSRLLEKKTTLSFQTLTVSGPLFLLKPRSESEGWSTWIPICEALTVYAEGLKTGFDSALVGMSQAELSASLRELSDTEQFGSILKNKYKIPDKGWANYLVTNQSKCTRWADEAIRNPLKQFAYRPFDFRWLSWPSKLLKAGSNVVGKHLQKKNLCLVVTRQVTGPEKVSHFYVSRFIPDNRIFYSKKGSATYFPVRRLDEGTFFTGQFLNSLSQKLGLRWNEDGCSENTYSTDDVAYYIYALFHSPAYRSTNDGSLRREFPRIPLTSNTKLFRDLVLLGNVLCSLHLMESPKLDDRVTTLVGDEQSEVETVSYSDETVWINKNKSTGFCGVSDGVWNFYVGGYQVCEKWLKDRKGRTLSTSDIVHYQKIIVALSETIRIMKEIDEVIDQHGGWPRAFQNKEIK